MTERNMKKRCLKAVNAINVAKGQCREILKIASNNNEQSSVDYWSRVNSRLVDYHAYLLDVLDASNDVNLITFDLNTVLSQVEGLTKEIDSRLTHILQAVSGSDERRRSAIYAYSSKSDMH